MYERQSLFGKTSGNIVCHVSLTEVVPMVTESMDIYTGCRFPGTGLTNDISIKL